MKLYNLPRGSKLRIDTENGMKDAIFGWLDGMYSYCYFEEDNDKVFHLFAATPMMVVGDRWEIAEYEGEHDG